MNSTIDYYNRNAETYFERTSNVDLGETYERFLRYIPAGGRIMDLGCGSGRDVKWFRDHGYKAYGLDASKELVDQAKENGGIPIEAGMMEEWITGEPYDGIWCCASLLHLKEDECERFFGNLKNNLKPGGVIYISVKSGIETGFDDEGRYFRNFNEDDICELVNRSNGLEIQELWYSKDSLARNGIKWLNVIAMR